MKLVYAILFWFILFDAEAKMICNDGCRCENKTRNETYVDCTGCNLRIVPYVDDWPVHANELDLSLNNITILEVGLTHEHIRVLRLNQNEIKTIKPMVFSGLINLLHLDLSHNELEEIADNTFHGQANLQSLNLSHNKLTMINDLTFSGLLLVQDLSLSANKIIHLQNSYWNRMYQLRRLDLSGIGSYFLEANLFHGLEKLEKLDISENDFNQVPTMSLRSAKNLTWLSLNGNPIEKLDKSSFLRLKTLKELDISFMENLVFISAGTFSELEKLTYLQISNNPNLKLISPDAFKGLFNDASKIKLKTINFQFNKLSSLPLIPCNSMQKMNLQGNPWSCDCRIRWIKRCFIPEVYAADLKCHYPETLREKLIVNTPETLFSCDIQQSQPFVDSLHQSRVMRATTFVLGFLLLVTLAVLIVSILKWRSIRSWWQNRKKGPGTVYYVRARANPIDI